MNTCDAATNVSVFDVLMVLKLGVACIFTVRITCMYTESYRCLCAAIVALSTRSLHVALMLISHALASLLQKSLQST